METYDAVALRMKELLKEHLPGGTVYVLSIVFADTTEGRFATNAAPADALKVAKATVESLAGLVAADHFPG